jgi:hypothetical protein
MALVAICPGSAFAAIISQQDEVYLGSFHYSANGQLAQVPSLMGTTNHWYLADSFASNFFNIGTNGGNNAGAQYVSQGTGLSGPNAVIRALDVRFVAQASSVDFNLAFYNGRNLGNSNAPLLAGFDLAFTNLNPAGPVIYSATITLDPSFYFTLDQDFEYGIKLNSLVGGTGTFGPALQPGQGLAFSAGGPALVGTHYNVFQNWSPAGQQAGTHNGDFWFGSGITAAARLGLTAVPEPGTASLMTVAGFGFLFRRRR